MGFIESPIFWIVLAAISEILAQIPNEKVKSNSLFEERKIQNIIKQSQANIVTVSPKYFVIELTGFREETEKLYNDLKPLGLLQFVRSGRISVTKEKMGISEILNTFKNNNNKN